jgi:hypothetical protein
MRPEKYSDSINSALGVTVWRRSELPASSANLRKPRRICNVQEKLTPPLGCLTVPQSYYALHSLAKISRS